MRYKDIFLLVIISSFFLSYEREMAEISHKPLKWEDLPILYHIHRDCYKPIDNQKCKEAIMNSFEVWESPSCTSLRFERGEDTVEDAASFNPDDLKSNKNIIVWLYDNWPYDQNGVALTTVTYDDKSGIIYDADIELNGYYFRFDVVEEFPSTYTDIQNTITHEIGHMIGLDHNYDPSSVMYPTARSGETKKRELSPDDIKGVCDIYPDEIGGCSCSTLAY